MHGDQPLLPLLNQVLDRVDVPVVAAGGLATGRDLAAMLAAGAAGVRMGTRFVATEESGAHPHYKQAIVDATAEETALVTDFSVLWPNGPEPHRVLTRALEAARRSPDVVGEAPAGGGRFPVPRFAVLPPTVGLHRRHRGVRHVRRNLGRLHRRDRARGHRADPHRRRGRGPPLAALSSWSGRRCHTLVATVAFLGFPPPRALRRIP